MSCSKQGSAKSTQAKKWSYIKNEIEQQGPGSSFDITSHSENREAARQPVSIVSSCETRRTNLSAIVAKAIFPFLLTPAKPLPTKSSTIYERAHERLQYEERECRRTSAADSFIIDFPAGVTKVLARARKASIVFVSCSFVVPAVD